MGVAMLPLALSVLAGLTLLAGACEPNRVIPENTSGCLPPDTRFVSWRLDYFKNLVSSTVASDSTVRASLGIPLANPSKVHLVTSQATCVAAVSAINARLNESHAARQVWVFTLGGGDYAVEDRAIDKKGAEWTPVFILDPHFRYKGSLIGW